MTVFKNQDEPYLAHQRQADDVDLLVGQRLKARRKALKLSQKDIGHALGISYQQIQKYESGTNRISAGRLFSLALMLDMAIEDFFDGAEAIYGMAPPRQDAETGKSYPTLHNPSLEGAFHDLMAEIIRARVAKR